MDSRILEVWRLTWPKAIPAHEYETALQMAALVGIAGRKPDLAEPKHQTVEATPGTFISAREAAALVGVHIRSIHNWGKRGQVRRTGSGKDLRFAREDVERMRGTPHALPPPRLVHSAVSGESPAGSISVKAAIKEFRVSSDTLYSAIKSGELKTLGRGPSAATGGRAPLLVARADIEAWNAARKAGEGA